MYPPLVFLSDPQAIRKIFAGDPAVFHAGDANRVLGPIMGPNSLLLLDGQRHRRERKLLMPAFHGERMRAYGELMRATTERYVNQWPVGRPFAVHAEMQKITLDLILRAVIGIDDEGRHEALRKRLLRLLSFVSTPALLFAVTPSGAPLAPRLQRALGRLSPLGRFAGLKSEVDDMLFEEFASRRGAGQTGREDVLSMLIEARDESGVGLTDAELRDEMLTLLVAGHETTATAVSWTLWRILRHPAVEQQLRAELREVTDGGPLEPGRVGALRYLDATIKETMRLNPTLPLVARLLQAPWQLGDYELPQGVYVAPNIWLTHRNPDVWPDPEQFRPERFLDRPVRPYHFFPFGGGTRTCLGMAFATYEMKMVLAEVLRRTRMRLQPGYRARVVRRSITFAPSRGMPLIVERLTA
jgi:cytochrome P450